MSYRIAVSGRSHAWGIDTERVKTAFTAFVRALDDATDAAGDDGTKVEMTLVVEGFEGVVETITADDVRERVA